MRMDRDRAGLQSSVCGTQLGKKTAPNPSFLTEHSKLIYKAWILALHRLSPMVAKSSHVLIKKSVPSARCNLCHVSPQTFFYNIIIFEI